MCELRMMVLDWHARHAHRSLQQRSSLGAAAIPSLQQRLSLQPSMQWQPLFQQTPSLHVDMYIDMCIDICVSIRADMCMVRQIEASVRTMLPSHQGIVAGHVLIHGHRHEYSIVAAATHTAAFDAAAVPARVHVYTCECAHVHVRSV